MWCQGWLICLWTGIHLGKSCACMLGRCSVGQVWTKKPDNWPKVNKGPEEVPYINDLPASLLSSSSLGGMLHPFSWCEHLCLASVLPKLFLCVLFHLFLCFVSNNKLCLFLQFLHSWLMNFSMRAKNQGKFASNLQPLMVWWLEFLIFIQPIHIQFLGKELRSSFTPLFIANSPRSGRQLKSDELLNQLSQLLMSLILVLLHACGGMASTIIIRIK